MIGLSVIKRLVLDALTITAQSLNFEIPKAAYLHIPFCRRRCYYCDFPVAVVGDRAHGDHSRTIEQYVEVLRQEIAATPAEQPLETVFFGGGTPSLLSGDQVEQILVALDHHFGIAATAEISMEMDPGTFDLDHLKRYRDAGVNRVSLGVQAFQPELLAACGRTHSVADVYEAVDLIHQAQLPNFSLDLISGLPHQTLEQWQASLESAIAIAPAHLSSYDLIVESVTPFGRQYQPGEHPLPSDTTSAEMYRLAQKLLVAAGYEHYEVSNYARPGYQCRHNRVYWHNQSFYGFGMGAASYLQGQRFTRPRKTREYYQWVQALKEGDSKIDAPMPTAQDQLLDTLMLGLRLAEGLSLHKLAEKFSQTSVETVLLSLQPYIQKGWVEVVGVSPGATSVSEADWQTARIQLSDPEGFLFSNTVLSALFAELE